MADITELVPADSDSAILKRKRRTYARRNPDSLSFSICKHLRVTLNEDTQLAECRTCGTFLSPFNVLWDLAGRWEAMKAEVAEYDRVAKARMLIDKAETVRKAIRKLQWVELPDEGNEPARMYWLKLTEHDGKEPYAIFVRRHRRRPDQWCILSESGAWSDLMTWLRRPPAKPKLEALP